MKLWAKYTAAAMISLVALLSACGGSGSDTSDSSGSATLRLALTDAPACGYEQVNVTIEKVRVHQSSAAGDSDAGWSEVVLNPAMRVDLLTLTNGVLAELGQTALPAGQYTQMRLVLAEGTSNPLANSVVPDGGAETALSTPSAFQSGLKMNLNIDVAANEIADFVLDFDACKSVIKRGNSGQFNLKPVISVVPRLSDAGMRVIGFVAPELAASTTSVSLQVDGTVVKSTPPGDDGMFVLYPVPVGTYDLVVNADTRVTATITGVPVVDTAFTHVNESAAAIDPPESTMRTASGTVTTDTAPIDATVIVIKKYAGGPNVEIAGAPVDGSTGEFSYPLPVDAPVKTDFVANASSLAFAADTATPTGLYTLQATSGIDTKTVGIDVTSADSTGTTFTFP